MNRRTLLKSIMALPGLRLLKRPSEPKYAQGGVIYIDCPPLVDRDGGPEAILPLSRDKDGRIKVNVVGDYAEFVRSSPQIARLIRRT